VETVPERVVQTVHEVGHEHVGHQRVVVRQLHGVVEENVCWQTDGKIRYTVKSAYTALADPGGRTRRAPPLTAA